jgi:hypothetical protein
MMIGLCGAELVRPESVGASQGFLGEPRLLPLTAALCYRCPRPPPVPAAACCRRFLPMHLLRPCPATRQRQRTLVLSPPPP